MSCYWGGWDGLEWDGMALEDGGGRRKEGGINGWMDGFWTGYDRGKWD